MRSSKNRQRSKQNRPRTLGNIVNRVFDSSGPEGKVRGTPQQIIEKYLILARDAQLSNDRVAAENFQQHAEHYTRMLGEAQREMAAEQEARQQSQGYRRDEGEGWSGNSNGNGNGERREGNWREGGGGERREGNWREGGGGERREGNWRGEQGRDPARRDFRPEGRPETRDDAQVSTVPDVVDLADDPRDANLVEVPEASVEPAPAPVQVAEGAEAGERRPPRRPRGPRKPREDETPVAEAPVTGD